MAGSPVPTSVDGLFEEHAELVSMYDRALDDKGRIVIPPTFRPYYAAGGRLVLWPERVLALWPIENFQRMDQYLRRKRREKLGNPNARDAMIGGAHPATPDSQGRIFIPERLRADAGIEREVAVVGAGHFVKIMVPERWKVISDDGTVAYHDEIQTDLGY